MLRNRPSVKQLNERFGTTGFFLTTLFANRERCPAIKQAYLGKRALNSLRKDYAVIPQGDYYYITNKIKD